MPGHLDVEDSPAARLRQRRAARNSTVSTESATAPAVASSPTATKSKGRRKKVGLVLHDLKDVVEDGVEEMTVKLRSKVS
jgi:hypothetical protein